jgi:hypothetical protein
VPYQLKLLQAIAVVSPELGCDTVIVVTDEARLVQPFASIAFTEKLPFELTVMLLLVAEFDQR